VQYNVTIMQEIPELEQRMEMQCPIKRFVQARN
jgi:hypothetical protein